MPWLRPFSRSRIIHTISVPHTKSVYRLRKPLSLSRQIYRMASSSQLAELKRYTACDIADTLLVLKVPNAGYLPDLVIRSYGPSDDGHVTIAPASTVLMVSKNGNADVGVESNIPSDKHWVDLTQPGTIVVMQQAKGQICAVVGGIMALRMAALKAKAVVVDGRVRDLDQLRESNLPVSHNISRPFSSSDLNSSAW